jgi:hypothetical protein
VKPIKPVLTQTLRNRWFALLLHGGLWLLLIASLGKLGGAATKYFQASATTPITNILVPIVRVENTAKLFAGASRGWTATNLLDPFFTRHFSPPAVPSPPPPTTKKIELTYQGFYETEGAARRAFIKLGDVLLDAPAGSNFTANLFLAGMNAQSATLTNLTGQTNVLEFSVKKEVEVPVK